MKKIKTVDEVRDFTAVRTKKIVSEKYETKPLVSVCLLTFGHVDFIEKCLDSIIDQKVDFPIEIIIGDDEVSGEASDIIDSYQKRFPEKISIYRSTENLGQYIKCGKYEYNLVRILDAAKGKYIQIIEGDDRFCDDSKLQVQADFLNGNLSYSGCCHAYNIIDENSQNLFHPEHVNYEKDLCMTMEQMIPIGGLPIALSSFMFRRKAFTLADWMIGASSMGTSIYCLVRNHGKVHYFKQIMSDYRKHPGGITGSSMWREFHETRLPKTYNLVKVLNSEHKDFGIKWLDSVRKDYIKYMINYKIQRKNRVVKMWIDYCKANLAIRFFFDLKYVITKKVKSKFGIRKGN